MNPLDIFAKFIRGDYFTGRMWKWTGLVVVIAFAMVYSSASMDQKVYRAEKYPGHRVRGNPVPDLSGEDGKRDARTVFRAGVQTDRPAGQYDTGGQKEVIG